VRHHTFFFPEKRKSDEFDDASDGAGFKRQKTDDITNKSQKVVKLLFQGEPSFEITLEPDKHQILGRTNTTLAAHVKGLSNDPHLSREAIDGTIANQFHSQSPKNAISPSVHFSACQ
jgi:hypothetical protein